MRKLITWMFALGCTVGAVLVLFAVNPAAAQLLAPFIGMGFGAIALLRVGP